MRRCDQCVCLIACAEEYSIAATAASAAPVKTIADLSLTQLQERLSQGQSQHSIHVGQSYSNPAGAAAAYLGHSSSGKSLGAAAGRGRAPTPTRQNSQGHAPSNGKQRKVLYYLCAR